MGFGSLLGVKAGPNANDQSIFTALNGPKIDRHDAARLRELLIPIPIKATTSQNEEISSLTVPRTPLREKILQDPEFRRTFRTLSFRVQDLDSKTMRLSDTMTTSVYVKDTKYNKLSHSKVKSPIPFDIRMRWLEDFAGEWGYVKIPAILILTVVGFVGYGTFKLGKYACAIVQEYSEATAGACTNDAGLEKAIRKRSGTQAPQRGTQPPQQGTPAPQRKAGPS